MTARVKPKPPAATSYAEGEMPRNEASMPTMSPAARPRETVGAVKHAIDLLRCLAEAHAPLGVNDVARRIALHKSSVSRLARTLERERIVQRDPVTGRLSLGVGLVALAAPVLAGFEARELARPLLQALAARTGETVSFNIWDGTEAVSIEQAPGSNSVRAFSRPGHRNPGHCTSAGKILLAHLGAGAIDAYCRRPLHRYTAQTITDAGMLREALAQCREQLFAVNLGELESDVGAVAAVAFEASGQPAGAITVTVPMYRFEPARRAELAREVLACAAELSAKLGHNRWPPHRGER